VRGVVIAGKSNLFCCLNNIPILEGIAPKTIVNSQLLFFFILFFFLKECPYYSR